MHDQPHLLTPGPHRQDQADGEPQAPFCGQVWRHLHQQRNEIVDQRVCHGTQVNDSPPPSEYFVSSDSNTGATRASALRTLTAGDHSASLVLDAYLLRSLALSGYEPTLDACVVCGAAGDQPFFHVPSGGTVCAEHRPPGSVAPRAESLRTMTALLIGDWNTADAADPGSQREVSGMVAAYAQWHLERDLRSLPLVERVP